VVKIDKLVSKVNENPTDTTAQIELINNLRQLPASRCTTSVDAMTAIANAQAALGQYDSAKVTIKKAIILDSKSEKAQASQKDIQEKWQTQKVFENQINYLQGYVDEYQKDKNKKYLRDSITTVLNRLNVNTPVHLEDKKV
jgi:tetratricopeptide (TPR) repeat protein